MIFRTGHARPATSGKGASTPISSIQTPATTLPGPWVLGGFGVVAAATIRFMSASLVCLLLRQVLQMLTQLAPDGGPQIELLVLRHQAAVLRRQARRVPCQNPSHRV